MCNIFTQEDWKKWRESGWGNAFRTMVRNSQQITFLSQVKNLNKPVTILDCGCAFGDLLATIQLANPSVKVKGVEIAKIPGNIAKKRLGKNNVAIQDCTKKLPFKDSQFDLIFSFDVIEHIADMKDVRNMFKELKRVVKKNGKVVISTPNGSWIMKIIYVLSGNAYIIEKSGHPNLFSHRKLKKELSKYFNCKDYKGFDLNLFTRLLSKIGIYKHLSFVCKK